MQKIGGVTLGTLMPKVNRGMAVSFTLQLLRLVSYLHSKGIVHRDIKPENIMIDAEIVYLIDFDLAFDASLPLRDDISVGTPLYVAPEVFTDRFATNSPGLDIFAVGVVFYEMMHPRHRNLFDPRCWKLSPEQLFEIQELCEHQEDRQMFIRRILEYQVPDFEYEFLSYDEAEFLFACLARLTKRPRADDLLVHKLFSGVSQ